MEAAGDRFRHVANVRVHVRRAIAECSAACDVRDVAQRDSHAGLWSMTELETLRAQHAVHLVVVLELAGADVGGRRARTQPVLDVHELGDGVHAVAYDTGRRASYRPRKLAADDDD